MKSLIRKIKLSDLQSCAEILEKSYSKPPYNEKFPSDSAFNYIKRKFDYCAEHSFVVEEDKNVIGFIFINLSYWTFGKQALIEEIVIDEDRQGQGYGKKLLAYSDEYLKSLGTKSLMLWGRKDASAYNFYLKNGFIEDENMMVMFKNFDK
jgi:aminoglycoside 6'-N-acetyltransferase I